MPQPDILTVDLSDKDRTHIQVLTSEMEQYMHPGCEAIVARTVEDRLDDYPLPVGSALHDVAQWSAKGATAIHVRGLQATQLSPTPLRYEPVSQATVYPFDLPHLVVASLIGSAYGSAHVRGGRILADIFPKAGFTNKQDSAFGSDRKFDYHADGVVQPDTAPDYFTLHCLRNAEQVPTFFSTVDEDDIDPDAYRLLTHPEYTLLYELGNDIDVLHDTPVILPQDNGVKLNYYGAGKIVCKSADPAYEDALDVFRDTLDRNGVEVVLKPNEILAVNNNRSLHGRRQFDADALPIDERRWLRRVFIAQRPELIQKINAATGRIVMSRYKLG